MGLGKTITCVSLIAVTLNAAQEFAQQPLSQPPKSPQEEQNSDPSLSTSQFSGSVWGMPDVSGTSDATSAKKRAQAQKEQDKLESMYVRARRIKVRSRATLIVCPLSTVVNWEDQFREHWAGKVQVVGGAGTNCNSAHASLAQIMPGLTFGASPPYKFGSQGEGEDNTNGEEDIKPTPSTLPAPDEQRRGTPLRVYIYHGNARRPDPKFLANFDAVITTYATLASEYSKQTKSIMSQDGDDEENESGEGANDASGMEIDEVGNQVIQIPKAKEKKCLKRKKQTTLFSGVVEASSALQSIHWFRVVLDEAQ